MRYLTHSPAAAVSPGRETAVACRLRGPKKENWGRYARAYVQLYANSVAYAWTYVLA
jgi:hypothetical protein